MAEPTALNAALVDAITKSTAATGEVFDAGKLLATDIYSVTKTGASKAMDFATAQIPDVVEQLLMWKTAEAIVYILAVLLLTLLFWVFQRKIAAYAKENNDVAALLLYNIFAGAGLLIGGGTTLVINLLVVVKITIAPKLYLVEYAAELLKKVVN